MLGKRKIRKAVVKIIKISLMGSLKSFGAPGKYPPSSPPPLLVCLLKTKLKVTTSTAVVVMVSLEYYMR